MKKVVKFGGSSLASAEQFKKVGEIIKADPDRVYVVPSAPGKGGPPVYRFAHSRENETAPPAGPPPRRHWPSAVPGE